MMRPSPSGGRRLANAWDRKERCGEVDGEMALQASGVVVSQVSGSKIEALFTSANSGPVEKADSTRREA